MEVDVSDDGAVGRLDVELQLGAQRLRRRVRREDRLPPVHVPPLVAAEVAPRRRAAARLVELVLAEPLERAAVHRRARPARRHVEQVHERLELAVDGRRALDALLAARVAEEVGDRRHPVRLVPPQRVAHALLPVVVPVQLPLAPAEPEEVAAPN